MLPCEQQVLSARNIRTPLSGGVVMRALFLLTVWKQKVYFSLKAYAQGGAISPEVRRMTNPGG
jgi:hypothetical protein